MFSKHRKHTIDILFVITLFLVFTVSVLMLTGTGAKVYERIVDHMETNYNSRTAYTYIFNKIHRADKNGSVRIGSLSGQDAVLLFEEIDNVAYCTYLYCYDGQLMELFTRYGQSMDPKYGTPILEVEKFSVTQETDTLYRFSITPKKGDAETVYVHTRSAKNNIE